MEAFVCAVCSQSYSTNEECLDHQQRRNHFLPSMRSERLGRGRQMRYLLNMEAEDDDLTLIQNMDHQDLPSRSVLHPQVEKYLAIKAEKSQDTVQPAVTEVVPSTLKRKSDAAFKEVMAGFQVVHPGSGCDWREDLIVKLIPKNMENCRALCLLPCSGSCSEKEHILNCRDRSYSPNVFKIHLSNLEKHFQRQHYVYSFYDIIFSSHFFVHRFSGRN